MVFKQIGTEVSFLSKSFKDIKKDFSSGLGIKQSLFSFISQNDIKALNDFEKAISNSSMTYKQAFDTYLSKAPIAIKRQANEIIKLTNQQRVLNAQRQAGKITEEQYNTAMTANKAKMQALTTQTQSLTLAQKASAVASKAAVIALNMLGNIAIMAGINLIITGITKLVNRQKELAEQAKESAEKVNEQAKSLEELKKKYEEICNSTDDEKTKNEQLNEIKQELIEKYGFEEEAIDKINTKREKGLELLEEEIRLNNKKSRGEWLGNNAEAIETAENAIETSYVGKKDGIISVDDLLNGGKINLDNISKSILDMFKSVKHYEYGVDDVAFLEQYTAFDVGGDDIIEKYENIQDIISALGNKTDRTDEEEQLLKLLNEESDAMEKILDKYQDTYETAKKLKAENLFDDYIDDNPIAEVNGKDAYLAWKDGLLKTAKGDKYIEQNLIDLIEEQFPDYTEYFENLAKAREQFGVTAPNSQYEAQKRAFLESLSPEDLEAALNIPDLFADGLEGATAKIEAWKADPKNKIAPDVDTSDLNTIIETASKKVKLITTAMEEMNDTGYISSSTYAEIVEMGGNFADCLEVQNGKLKLNVQKLKELERQENLNAIAAKNLAISELQAAAAMAAQSHDAEKVDEIRKQITALEEEKAVLWQINDEIANAKPNESDSGGSSSSSNDPWKEQFDKQYSEKQHLLAMEQLSEEDYLDWLDDAYKKYFFDLTKYQDEYYKYEEEVYKGRKQLAEDYFDEQQKLFEDRVSNLETQIEITTKTSESSDGTKLNTKEKYDDIRNGYQEIINIIEERINEIVQAGVEGHEDLLAELEKQLEEYKEKLSDVFKSAVEEEKDYIEKQKDAFSDAYDERIDKIKEEKEAAEEAAQAEIDAIQEKINTLEKANKKAEEANDIEKARQELEKAKNQRTIATVSANGTISYQADKEKIQEAQEELDKLLQEQQINILEDQKEALESVKDKQSEAFDTIISDLESEKEAGERRFDVLLKVLDDYLNPDTSTSNIDVWSTLAKTEGVKLGKNGQWIDKDGKVIDIEALMKSAETKTDAEKNAGTDSSKDNKDDSKDKTNGKGVEIGRIEKQSFDSENTEDKTDSVIDSFFAKLEKQLNLEQGSLTLEKVMSILTPSMKYNPYGAMNERMNKVYRNEYVSNVNNNNSDSNITFSGDININNPVANSYDLAEDIVKNLPNAVAKQIHKKNQ